MTPKPHLTPLYDPATFTEDHLHDDRGIVGWLTRARKDKVLQALEAELTAPPAGQRLRLLDVGCGYGEIIDEAYKRTSSKAPMEAWGIDINLAALTQAVARVPLAHFLCADASRLPFPDSAFDGVICSEVMEHLPAPEPLVAEIMRVTRPNGIFCLTVPNEWVTTFGRALLGKRPWKTPAHLRDYSPHSFCGAVPVPPVRLDRAPFSLLPFRLSTHLVGLFRKPAN